MAFNLAAIKRGREELPPRIVVFGVEGIGKTTFAAGAPAPIFIQTEDGLGGLDVARFPLCQSIDDVLSAIGTLYGEQHDFGTVCLDSLDWCENLIWRQIEEKHDAKDLAYGKGAVIAAEKWRELLEGLNALRLEKGMAVLLIAHCAIKRFDSPETEPYDRYVLKLQDRSSALVREWADAVLFANYKTVTRSTDVGFQQKVTRGVSTGERLLFTSERPAYLAKNRYALPESLPMSWQSLQDAITQGA